MNRDRYTAASASFSTLSAVLLVCLGILQAAHAQQLLLDSPAFSASPKELLQVATEAPKLSDAEVVVLLDEQRDTIDQDGRERQTMHLIYRVDKQRGVESWASVSTEYWPWYQLQPTIRARVITPDGIQHDLDLKSLADNAVRDDDENVFSDRHVYEGPLPAVSIGAVVEEETVVTDKTPFFQGSWSESFLIGRHQPVFCTRLVVELPTSMALHYKPLLAPELKTSKTENGGTTTYRFDYGRTEPLESRPMLPPDEPHYPGILLTTADTWNDLAVQYWKRTEPQIRPEEVKTLVGGLHGDEESTIAQLLAKVHDSVRYTGLEFGEANLTPQPPSETLKRKYGDCKDKATLLVSMLRAAGIPSYLALLNSGDGRDVYPDLPGMSHFNHAIAYIPSREMFVDATAEYSRVGELPSDDQNRWALIVSEATTQLKRTPQLPSSTNRTLEEREFFLQDFGPARVVETTTWYGNGESAIRSSFSGGEGKDYKKKLDEYVQSEYLADGVGKYERADAAKLNEPFSLKLEVPRAKRGNTGLTDALIAIRLIDLVSGRIPEEFKKDEKNDTESKPRTVDWYLEEVSQSEWRYRVLPPPGFRVRALPESKTMNFGPAVLSEDFKSSEDGAVEATIRFDLVKRSYSPADVTELKKALQQLRANGVQFVRFDLTANTLMGQGKVREALFEYRKLVQEHPKEAIGRARLARACLTASLGEMAREEAREAVKLDPKSTVAYDTLGWVLLHDVIGRKFIKGFDPVGAAAAYRKAKELDPKEPSYALSLGEALEYDSSGERYVGVKLDEAVTVYRELKKNEDADADSVNEHLLYSLAYSRRFKELGDALADLADTPLTRFMKILAVAGLDGGDAAIARASQITKDEKTKSDALASAGTLAMRIRMYPEAAAMLAAAADGQTNAGAMANLAQVLKHTTRHEEIKAVDGDPGNLVRRATALQIYPERRAELIKFLSRASGELAAGYRSELVKNYWSARFPADLPQKVYMDVTQALLKIGLEGDEVTGFRVTSQASGTVAEHVFVLKEDGELKLLCGAADLAPLGQEVLDRIAKGDLKGAKVLLDWARDERKLGGGEDPYAGYWFARVWNKSDDPNPDAMRVAAIVLIATVPDSTKPYIDWLESARRKAATDAERDKFDLARASAYRNVRDWQKLEQLTAIMLAKTSSPTLFQILATCKTHQNKWDELATLVEQQRGKLDNDYVLAITESRSYVLQGRPAQAMEVLKRLIDSAKGNESAVNAYGWDAVIAGEVKPDALELVQQAVQQPSNQNYAILHTLGCMYAIADRPAKAQQVLLDAMKHDKSIDAPQSSIWFGFGLLAESYGEKTAAAKLYRMVEAPKYDQTDADSTYMLAQQRLKALHMFP
jgi:transglutaminase-like putative cysteine protease/tetratricopeptide (TPR) repeat protein